MTNTQINELSTSERLASLRKLTNVLYALYALTWFSGGLTALVAVIINYIKRDDTIGTLYESHFRWQINTFWRGIIWGVIGAVLCLIAIGFVVLAILTVWMIYRIAKGWLYLNENRVIGVGTPPSPSHVVLPPPPPYQQ